MPSAVLRRRNPPANAKSQKKEANMLFVLICQDKPDSEALRKSVRNDHLQYLDDYDVRFAGPMLSPDATTMIGSIVVIEALNLEAAEAFAAADPYGQAGLFAQVNIHPFRQVVPA